MKSQPSGSSPHDISSDPLEILESALVRSNGIITVADAATLTGSSVHEARENIIRLIELYDAEAHIDEQGTATLFFRLPLHRRRPLLLGEWWQRKLSAVERSVRRNLRVVIVIGFVFYIGWFFLLVQLIVMVLRVVAGVVESTPSTGRGRGRQSSSTGRRVVHRLKERFKQLEDDIYTPPRSTVRVTRDDLARGSTDLPMKPWLKAVGDYVLGEDLDRGGHDRPREFASYLRYRFVRIALELKAAKRARFGIR